MAVTQLEKRIDLFTATEALPKEQKQWLVLLRRFARHRRRAVMALELTHIGKESREDSCRNLRAAMASARALSRCSQPGPRPSRHPRIRVALDGSRDHRPVG